MGLDTGTPGQKAAARIARLILQQPVVDLFAPVWPCFAPSAHSLHTIYPHQARQNTPTRARTRARTRTRARGRGGCASRRRAFVVYGFGLTKNITNAV